MSVANELKEVNKGSVERLMTMLRKYEGILGPTNHHMVEVHFRYILFSHLTLVRVECQSTVKAGLVAF